MYTRLYLAKSLRSAIEGGHPWVYRAGLRNIPEVLDSGEIVELHDRDGFVCWGVYEHGHTIAVRVWSLQKDQPPTVAFLTQCLTRAWRLRQAVLPAGVDGFRLVHGAADGCPGWSIDVYGNHLVIRSDGQAAKMRLPLLLEAISKSCLPSYASIIHRKSRNENGQKWEILQGSPPEQLVCREYSWQMEVDILEGQKTGWFIDQRDNRRLIFEMCGNGQKLRVANLFCYTGGFSLAAALGGAFEVCSVDISKPAIAAAMRNFELNGLSREEYEFCAEDCFDWLSRNRNEGREFDLIIIDPPSFAPNRRSVSSAKRAYGKLFSGAAELLASDGWLAASSCSSHMGRDTFANLVDSALRSANRSCNVIADREAGMDHPKRIHFPEAHYLKFLLCQTHAQRPI